MPVDNTDYYAVAENLDPNRVLDESTAHLYVDIAEARGDITTKALYKQLGLDQSKKLKIRMERQYILFTSHLGGGKSTELRRIWRELHHPDRFFVVFLDALTELNTQNLHYTDVLLMQARLLCEALANNGIVIDDIYLQRLRGWFDKKVQIRLQEQVLALELSAGVETKGGIPWLGTLFGKLTSSIRDGTTYREEIRTETTNNLSEFAEGFNQLLRAANEAVARHGLGQRILFIVDGTDRLSSKDMERFFVDDFLELQRINACFIYCCQIYLLYKHNFLQQRFDYVHRIPMIKLHQRATQEFWPPALAAMREMVYKRVAPSLFDCEETVDYLIRHSGGHPRDLVRLLGLTRINASGERFDREAAERAVRHMAADFLRFLLGKDYDLLVKTDRQEVEGAQEAGEGTHSLLHTLALLEYNNLWWHSHPLVRTLPGYKTRWEKHDG